ncbi:tetratricopeptide repeat protein [Aquimonas voraii]|uniref:Predicted methyltransferase, contains TPR repeat n=1 Tax=Aquimonas voraii TaxID=265719 RepID=A0A1G6W1R4_9GAMM|nr:tetratricopeptide repeat protein [Aquimonas voraii]SDD59653.1 Predicted methyltransferase, contains TPR repeat [Aquimonas voraii]
MSTPQLEAALNLHRAGRLDEAEQAYRALLPTQPASAGRLLGVLLLQRERWTEAAAVLAPLSQAEPRDAELAVNASLALRRSGQVEPALLAARCATASDPQRMSAWNALGLAAMESAAFDEALAAFESGLKLSPGHPALCLHRAQCLRRLGRYHEAGQAFFELLQADPTLLEGWRGLAMVNAALGSHDLALECRTRALSLQPADPELRLEHAIAQLLHEQVEAAVRSIEALIADGHDDAQTWAWLGRAQLKRGEREAARAAFVEAQKRDPQDQVAAHFLAALTGELPSGVESDYIRRLFDDFAGHFESTLVGKLGYATPARLAAFIREHAGDRFASVLDLGCGTGLMAVELAAEGRVIDGVDLSTRMLDVARDKGLYRSLYASEVLEFLRGLDQRWDLIAAADVFVYIAELAPVFAAAFERLPPGGVLAFSIERSASDATELPAETGRYRHAPQALRAQLAACGFIDIAEQPSEIRLEKGEPVAGVLLLAKRPR